MQQRRWDHLAREHITALSVRQMCERVRGPVFETGPFLAKTIPSRPSLRHRQVSSLDRTGIWAAPSRKSAREVGAWLRGAGPCHHHVGAIARAAVAGSRSVKPGLPYRRQNSSSKVRLNASGPAGLPPGAVAHRADNKRPRNLRGGEWRGILDKPEALTTP